MKSKIQEHFKNKSLKIHYFKDFSRTTYNSRTIQGIQVIQEPLATLKTNNILLKLLMSEKQAFPRRNFCIKNIFFLVILLTPPFTLDLIPNHPIHYWKVMLTLTLQEWLLATDIIFDKNTWWKKSKIKWKAATTTCLWKFAGCFVLRYCPWHPK